MGRSGRRGGGRGGLRIGPHRRTRGLHDHHGSGDVHQPPVDHDDRGARHDRPLTTTSTTTSAAAACSEVRLSPQVAPETGLPAPAAAMRADLARAAATCDWGLLATLADRNGAGVSYTFGPVGDPIAFWREADENGHGLPPMFALRTLLGLPYGTQALPGGRVQYVWPAAFAAGHPTDAQLQEIADAGLYPLATLQEWRATGDNYLGYRVIVTATGDWTAFVAGD